MAVGNICPPLDHWKQIGNRNWKHELERYVFVTQKMDNIIGKICEKQKLRGQHKIDPGVGFRWQWAALTY